MPNWIFPIAETAQRELLLFSAIWLLIGAIDDLCVDAIWAGRRLYRKIAFYWHRPPMTVDELPAKSGPGLIAVLIPAWGEAAVIGTMLANCTRSWANSGCEYRIYVGCYPNDPHTSAAVIRAAKHNPVIRLVLVDHMGPTTKADCLNRLWKALRADEIAGGYTAKAIVLHDAEDAVHADELRVFDRLLTIGGAVQLPVIPVRTKSSRWISGHYCDEFAEAHGKNMVVREAIGASLPLAGVACAIERNLMGRLAIMNGGDPFDPNSLTEDYELGMRIGAAGGRTIMARILDNNGRLIGTRSCFPDTLTSSVRQKTRWLTGIALAGWDRLGWNGNLAQKWMLLQDRRSILAAIVLSAAYACIFLTAMLTVAEAQGAYQPKPLAPTLIVLLWCNAAFLFWRLFVRAGFVAALYGPKEALLSIPRSVMTNIIAIMAARRACINYARHCFGVPLRWDKTVHHIVPAPSVRPE
ncbi:glycosyl transferase family protein [Sphingorhabdus sp.]|uniref:glycosyl transferase family protein n=1 Tax=Sphingorhabdus sp. TaxID=1902408 RepID=UPI0037C7F1EB